MGLLPFSVKAVAEGKVALTRLKVGLFHISLILSKTKDNYLSFIPKPLLKRYSLFLVILYLWPHYLL